MGAQAILAQAVFVVFLHRPFWDRSALNYFFSVSTFHT